MQLLFVNFAFEWLTHVFLRCVQFGQLISLADMGVLSNGSGCTVEGYEADIRLKQHCNLCSNLHCSFCWINLD